MYTKTTTTKTTTMKKRQVNLPVPTTKYSAIFWEEIIAITRNNVASKLDSLPESDCWCHLLALRRKFFCGSNVPCNEYNLNICYQFTTRLFRIIQILELLLHEAAWSRNYILAIVTSLFISRHCENQQHKHQGGLHVTDWKYSNVASFLILSIFFNEKLPLSLTRLILHSGFRDKCNYKEWRW